MTSGARTYVVGSADREELPYIRKFYVRKHMAPCFDQMIYISHAYTIHAKHVHVLQYVLDIERSIELALAIGGSPHVYSGVPIESEVGRCPFRPEACFYFSFGGEKGREG